MKHATSSTGRVLAACAAAILLRAFAPDASTAQTTLPFFTDFSEGIPSGWEGVPGDGVRWERRDTLGMVDSGALVVDMGHTWIHDTAVLRTEWFRLGSTPNPVLRMNFALVNLNFIAPILSLWSESAGGEQRRLEAWGQQFGEEPVVWVEKSDNQQLPLRRENLQSVEISYRLDELAAGGDVRFELRAEMVNGGWLILDNFRIESDTASGVEVERVAPERVDLR